tara:strand:- start:66 stop:215 length:150 start_codon:yes stop_codon:yes gene_type:complete
MALLVQQILVEAEVAEVLKILQRLNILAQEQQVVKELLLLDINFNKNFR